MSRGSWWSGGLIAVCILWAADAGATVLLDAATVGSGPYYLSVEGETYVLTEDLETPGSALVFAAQDVTLDLNGHTITFGGSSSTSRFGVAIPPAYPHSSWVTNTDITTYQVSTGALIKNGSIVQGTGRASKCTAITSLEQHDITVENVSITIYGDDTHAIKFTDCYDLRVTDCVITDNTTVISNRHQGRAAIDLVNARNGRLEIARNTIHSAPQWGIRVSRRTPTTVTGRIFDNQINLENIVTNGYGLGLHGDNLEAYSNTIQATNGRGIHLENCSSISVHHNTVDVMNEPFWSEYYSMQSHGIKLERCSNADVFANEVTSYGRYETTAANCNGVGLSITVYPNSNNYIHDNTFTARHLGGQLFDPSDYTKYSTTIDMIYIGPSSGLRIENNTFITQDRFISTQAAWTNNPDVDPMDVTDLIIRGNTWLRESTPVSTQKLDVFWASHVTGLRLIDNLGEPDFRNYGNGWPWNPNQWSASCSGVVRTVDAANTPIPGVPMEIKDRQGTVVFSGRSNAKGELAVVLDEFNGVSGSGITELGPYVFTAAFADENVVSEAIIQPGFTVSLQSDSVRPPYPPGRLERQMTVSEPYPNPFTADTRLRMSLPENGVEYLKITILDIVGRQVGRLHDGPSRGGEQEYSWTARDKAGRDLPTGVYFLVVQAPDFFQSRKIILSR